MNNKKSALEIEINEKRRKNETEKETWILLSTTTRMKMKNENLLRGDFRQRGSLTMRHGGGEDRTPKQLRQTLLAVWKPEQRNTTYNFPD